MFQTYLRLQLGQGVMWARRIRQDGGTGEEGALDQRELEPCYFRNERIGG